MPVYEYTALDRSGKSINGIIDADSAVSARQKLRGSGAFPVEVKETYPRKLVDILHLPDAQYKHSKQNLWPFTEQLQTISGVQFSAAQISSWHHVDAFLAFLSGLRYLGKNDHKYGIPEEGVVIV